MGRKDGDSRRKLELVQSSFFVGLKERVRLVIIHLQMREGDWMKNQGALCALFGGAIWDFLALVVSFFLRIVR